MAGDVFISVAKDKSVGLFSLDNMNWYRRFPLPFVALLCHRTRRTLTHGADVRKVYTFLAATQPRYAILGGGQSRTTSLYSVRTARCQCGR